MPPETPDVLNDLQPSTSTFYTPKEPKEQAEEKKKERAKVLSSIPLAEDIIKHFEERIAFYGSIDSIEVDFDSKPQDHINMMNANRLTKQNLEQERDWLQNLINNHGRT